MAGQPVMEKASPNVAAVVLTYNERERIGDCLTTLTWAGEMVIVDSGSGDGTADLAIGFGATVLEREFVNFADQRNFALDNVEATWILFVDADELVTQELANEIKDRVGTEGHAGYWLPRRNRILGGWLRATGWHPDRQLRLLRRADARYVDDRPVHETVKLDGSAGIMKAGLRHEGPSTAGEFRRKQSLYLELAVRGCGFAVSGRGPQPDDSGVAGVSAPLRDLARLPGWLARSGSKPADGGARISGLPEAACAFLRFRVTPRLDLSAVIVSYNVRERLRVCLDSVRTAGRGSGLEIETVVVDNMSTDSSAEMVETEFPDIALLRNGRNEGYGAACNRGAAASTGSVLLFLNADVELTEGSVRELRDAVGGGRRRPRGTDAGRA